MKTAILLLLSTILISAAAEPTLEDRLAIATNMVARCTTNVAAKQAEWHAADDARRLALEAKINAAPYRQAVAIAEQRQAVAERQLAEWKLAELRTRQAIKARDAYKK